MTFLMKEKTQSTSFLHGWNDTTLTVLFFMPLTSPIDQKYDLVLIYSILIAFVGFVDDRYNLNVGGKLALQNCNLSNNK